MGPSSKYLKLEVDKIAFNEFKFRIRVNEDYCVFGAIHQNDEENQYFSISTIYDTIVNLVEGSKYSFYKVIDFNLSEKLSDHNPFIVPDKKDKLSLYYIENMIFRTMTLWDSLAQLYNIYKNINKPINEIYVHQLFHNYSQGKKGDPFAKKVYNYMVERDKILGDLELWEGNHTYVKNYRDQMMHRNSPSITTVSSYDSNLRAPAIYTLKRVTEDFIVVTEFIQKLTDDIYEKYADNE